MEYKESIEIVLAKYSDIKELYIECEETDPELKTNLQPLNEFRAALDHVMKMLLARYSGNDAEVQEQFRKLNSHLDRCFYDVCDMLSINYRNKIVDVLEMYEVDEIRTALPTYYSEMKPNIDAIGSRIVSYRNKKGTMESTSEATLDSFEEYKADVLLLKSIHSTVVAAQSEMEEIKQKEKKRTTRENSKNLLLGGAIGVLGSALVSLIFYLLGT